MVVKIHGRRVAAWARRARDFALADEPSLAPLPTLPPRGHRRIRSPVGTADPGPSQTRAVPGLQRTTSLVLRCARDTPVKLSPKTAPLPQSARSAATVRR